jgi:hypothetical protein
MLNHSKPDTWNIMFLGTGMDPDVMTWDEVVPYFQQLKLCQALENRANHEVNGTKNGKFNKQKREIESTANGNVNGGGKRNYGSNSGSGNRVGNGGNNPKVQCKHCNKYHADKCWTLEENKNLRPKRARYDNNNNVEKGKNQPNQRI